MQIRKGFPGKKRVFLEKLLCVRQEVLCAASKPDFGSCAEPGERSGFPWPCEMGFWGALVAHGRSSELQGGARM